MTKKLSEKQIDGILDGLIGVGPHRDVPVFGFDPDMRLRPLRGVEWDRDGLPPRRSAAIPETPTPSLEQTPELPDFVRKLLV